MLGADVRRRGGRSRASENARVIVTRVSALGRIVINAAAARVRANQRRAGGDAGRGVGAGYWMNP